MVKPQGLSEVMVMNDVMAIPEIGTQILYVHPNFDRIWTSHICLVLVFSYLSVGANPMGAPRSHGSQTAIFPKPNNSVEKCLT